MMNGSQAAALQDFQPPARSALLVGVFLWFPKQALRAVGKFPRLVDTPSKRGLSLFDLLLDAPAGAIYHHVPTLCERTGPARAKFLLRCRILGV